MVVSATSFKAQAILDGVVLLNTTVASDSNATIAVPKGSTGFIHVAMRLDGEHIKGSPHFIEAFVPVHSNKMDPELVGGIAGGFVFLLALLAFRFRQHQKKSAARIAQEQQ